MRFKHILYLTCMLLACMILSICFLGIMVPAQPIWYASVHPVSTIPPIHGFSENALINIGEMDALDQLPGVGEVIAQRIKDTRVYLGGFRIPEDLLLVKGIGEKTLAKILTALPDVLVELSPLEE